MKLPLHHLAFAMLFCVSIAQAVTDPLNPANLPVIDTNPADYPANIWITDDMQKIRQDAGAPGSTHWGTFYGIQNEFIDFQVHLHDTGNGTPNMTVTAGNFVNAQTGYVISSTSTNIVVYREAYINVSPTPSNTGSSTFYKTTGFYPDVLIPTIDPYWHQTTNAWPFTVAANHNQSAWIDVLIPPNAPSGYYLGSVTVQSSVVSSTMPVILAVWQWPAAQGGQMPSTTSLKAAVGNWTYNGLCSEMYSADYVTANCGSYPGAGGSNDFANTLIWLDASLLMKDHRYTMSGAQNIYPQTGSFSAWDTYVGPLMNGGCIPHPGAPSPCPMLAGAKQTAKSIDYVGNSSTAIWSNWQSHFNANGWGSALFHYLVDEPHGVSAFQSFVSSAALDHGYLNPGIPELVTTDIWWGQFSPSAADAFSISVCGSPTCILNSIDIMVSTIYYFEFEGQTPETPAPYQAWMQGSADSIPRQWWMYQACTSAGTCSDGVPGPAGEGLGPGNVWNYPNYNVDGVPAANRAFQWMSALHGNSGELYYAADVCNTSSYHAACTASGQSWDPWDGIYYSGGWGDGTLVYAGSVTSGMINYMGAGVTIPIVLPSLRLKLIRDGMQDYEYINALKKAGQETFVLQQINSWITNSYTFDTTGVGLMQARQNLGNALHQLGISGGGAPGGLPAPQVPFGDLPISSPLDVANASTFAGYTIDWTFTPLTVTGSAASPMQARSSSSSTIAASGSAVEPVNAGLSLGTYQVNVTVVDGSNDIVASASGQITFVSADLSGIRVYPNPWRSDKHAGKSMVFDQLPANCTIKLFTVSGRKMREFDNVNGSVSWDLTNDGGDKVGSGIYLYVVTDPQGDKVKGKIGIIR